MSPSVDENSNILVETSGIYETKSRWILMIGIVVLEA